MVTESTAVRTRELTQIFEMMEHLGIKPGAGVLPHLGVKYLTAFRRCEGCLSKQACRNWLDDHSTLALFAPGFCPNARALFELAIGANVAPPEKRLLGRVVTGGIYSPYHSVKS
jgi:hypothetical protein